MGLIYDGKLITPAPLVTVTKNYIFGEDEQKLGSEYSISLKSSLLPNRGSPNSSGTFDTTGDGLVDENFTTSDTKFASILRKQEAIRNLFSDDGLTLEWTPESGGTVKCYPKVQSINFQDGTWVQKCDYSIDLQAPALFTPSSGIEDTYEDVTSDDDFSDYYLSSASDSWQVKETDDGSDVILLTHTVSARSRRKFQEDGTGNLIGLPSAPTTPVETWELAKAWCITRLNRADNTFGTVAQTFIENKADIVVDFDASPTFQTHDIAYNRVKNEQIDRLKGEYTITETWILSKEPGIEEYTVTRENNVSEVAGDGVINRVVISGSIKGLETMDGNSKYQNASLMWDGAYSPGNVRSLLVTRVQDLSGLTVNALPKRKSVAHNQKAGTIAYTFEFDDRPDFTGICDDFAEVSISVRDDYQHDIAVVIPIPGRTTGPIIQWMNTLSERRRSLNINVVLADKDAGWSYSDIETIRDCIDDLIDNQNLLPSGTRTVNYFLVTDNDSFDYINGNYSANKAYLIKV